MSEPSTPNKNRRSGCSAQELVLPGESAEELQERCEHWEQDLAAVTAPERYEVFNAVHATWRQDRMRRAEAIALADLVDKTTEHFHEQKEQEARDLIARLPEAPGESIQGLRNSTAGLTWMIDQVGLLALQVAQSGRLTPSQRRHLIHLCGKRLVDLFVDPVVTTWNWLYLAVTFSQVPNPEEAAVFELECDRPPAMEAFEFEYRVKDIARRLPPAEEARAELTQKLDEMLAELTERHELIGPREERDLARAIGKAKGDAGAETAKRQRVENSMDRQRRMSLKEVRALRKSRPEPGDDGPDDDGHGDDDGTPAEPGPGTDPNTSPTQPEPGTNHECGAPEEPAVTTAATGNAVVTGPVTPVAAPAEAIKATTIDTIAEADTPQKFKTEPTCQNGRPGGEVVPEQKTEAAGGVAALSQPSGTLSEAQALGSALALTCPLGTLPEAEVPGCALALTRPSGTLSQGERVCCAGVRAAPDATVGVTGSAIPRAGTDSVIPNGGAKDDMSDTNRFPGATGHQ